MSNATARPWGNHPKCPIPNKSAAYLRGARIGKGVSAKEAARHIGCSVRTLQRYEREGVRWTTGVSNIAGICGYYGLSAETLRTLIGQEIGGEE